jgi:hypothetical protein
MFQIDQWSHLDTPPTIHLQYQTWHDPPPLAKMTSWWPPRQRWLDQCIEWWSMIWAWYWYQVYQSRFQTKVDILCSGHWRRWRACWTGTAKSRKTIPFVYAVEGWERMGVHSKSNYRIKTNMQRKGEPNGAMLSGHLDTGVWKGVMDQFRSGSLW